MIDGFSVLVGVAGTIVVEFVIGLFMLGTFELCCRAEDDTTGAMIVDQDDPDAIPLKAIGAARWPE